MMHIEHKRAQNTSTRKLSVGRDVNGIMKLIKCCRNDLEYFLNHKYQYHIQEHFFNKTLIFNDKCYIFQGKCIININHI